MCLRTRGEEERRKMQDEGPGNCEDSVTPRNPWPYLQGHRSAGEDVQGGCGLSFGVRREGLGLQVGQRETALHQDVVISSVWRAAEQFSGSAGWEGEDLAQGWC